MDKNGIFSTYKSISQIAPKFIIKNESENIIAYPETSKKMSILIHEDSDDMLGEVSKMLEINLSANIHSAYIVHDKILFLIDEYNVTTAWSLDNAHLKKISTTELYPNQGNHLRTSHRSTTSTATNSYVNSAHKFKFNLSNGYLLAHNINSSIFDLFALSNNYEPNYITSLKTQLSPHCVSNIHLNFFGYPIITIFEKKMKGFQIISYLFFETTFVILGDKKVLNYEFIKKIKDFGEKIYVIGGKSGTDGGRIVSFALNL